jgi:hypothetical protein
MVGFIQNSVSRTGSGQVGVDSVDPGVPWGRAPKVPEKAGWVGFDFIRTRPEVLPRGPRGGTPIFRGSGQVGVDSRPRRSLKGQGRAVLIVSRLIGYPNSEGAGKI